MHFAPSEKARLTIMFADKHWAQLQAKDFIMPSVWISTLAGGESPGYGVLQASSKGMCILVWHKLPWHTPMGMALGENRCIKNVELSGFEINEVLLTALYRGVWAFEVEAFSESVVLAASMRLVLNDLRLFSSQTGWTLPGVYRIQEERSPAAEARW